MARSGKDRPNGYVVGADETLACLEDREEQRGERERGAQPLGRRQAGGKQPAADEAEEDRREEEERAQSEGAWRLDVGSKEPWTLARPEASS